MSLPIFHMVSGAPDPVAPFSHAVETDGLKLEATMPDNNSSGILQWKVE